MFSSLSVVHTAVILALEESPLLSPHCPLSVSAVTDSPVMRVSPHGLWWFCPPVLPAAHSVLATPPSPVRHFPKYSLWGCVFRLRFRAGRVSLHTHRATHTHRQQRVHPWSSCPGMGPLGGGCIKRGGGQIMAQGLRNSALTCLGKNGLSVSVVTL